MNWLEYDASMKRNVMAYVMSSAVALWLIAGYMPAAADVLGVEAWSNRTLQGWTCWDIVNEVPVDGMAASNDFLDVAFPAQFMKMPPLEYMVKADTNASSGLLTGNYFSNGVQFLSFRVKCDYGSTVCAVIHGNGQSWRYQVPDLPTGLWVNVTVPVSPAVLKSMCATNNSEEFSQALNAVDWIGITFLRNNTLNAYHCYIDDVTLCGAGVGYGAWINQFAGSAADKLPGADLGGNGVDNLSEWIAGVDPSVKGAVFSLQSISPEPNGSNGFTLVWSSVSGRQYQVWRTENLTSGFSSISGWILAAPPTNTFNDESAAGLASCFYKLKVRKVE